VGRAAELVTAFFREVFAREDLPPAPSSPPPSLREPAGGPWRLFQPESLTDLPPRAAPKGDGRSALGRLLGPDPLPEDPPLPRPSRGRWLAWLFAPERLDP
jgi:hypothetical protein